MERASRILGKLQIKPVEVAGVKTYHLAPGAWAAAVGKKIASHTRPVFLKDGTLTVEVEDAVWQTQLRTLESSILPRIEKIVGGGFVQRIEFRLAAPRRQVAIAATAHSALDDAATIADPVMRHVYRTARRKAKA